VAAGPVLVLESVGCHNGCRAMTPRQILYAAALAACALPAAAACLSDVEVIALMAAYEARKPAANPEGLSQTDGECTRSKVQGALEAKLGKPVGYKAGLTNPAVQKRFNASAPVWGALYAPMMLKDGATVEAAFGARPLFEADMLVRVSDAAVNRARTPEDVLEAIDQVIPAIELPDLMVQAPGQLSGASITAINVGARYFIVGQPLPVPSTRGERYQLFEALRDMVALVNVDGSEIDRGKGSDVLGHPLAAVAWLVQDMARQGQALRVGDLISLGSFSRLTPPKPGQAVEVSYWGLPGTPAVKVTFK
jgi:2-keto-4-pentenoate hydratase